MALPLLLILVLVLATACLFFSWRPPELWEIPAGYKGWIVVSYGRAECPRLERREGMLVYRIPSDGQLCTSDALPQGSAEDRYEYVSDGGRTPLRYPDEVRQLTTEAISQKLLAFVGSREEQERAADSKPEPFR